MLVTLQLPDKNDKPNFCIVNVSRDSRECWCLCFTDDHSDSIKTNQDYQDYTVLKKKDIS